MYPDGDIARLKVLAYTAPGATVVPGTVSVARHPASTYARLSDGCGAHSPLAVHETSPAEAAKPRLLDRVRAALRSRHYSRRTEEAYVSWIRRYILFHGKRHPVEMGAPEITRFLSALAVKDKVAASTQNQALSVARRECEVRPTVCPRLEGRDRGQDGVSSKISHDWIHSRASSPNVAVTSRPPRANVLG